MDRYYDSSSARELLIKTTTGRNKQCPEHLCLAEYSKEDGVAKQARVIEIKFPRSWKLATSPDEEGMQEELVLRMQGIVCDRNLPPIKTPQTIPPRECRFKRQSIMLTGFSAEQVQTYAKGIQAIFAIFQEALLEKTIEEWSPMLFNGHIAIDMGNRFFTERRNQSNEEMVPFKHSVDPYGILETAMGSEYIHLRENEVEYFQWIDDRKGGNSYIAIEPAKINKGDIVEAQISFKVVPIKNNMFKPLIVLRAVTLLDNRPTKARIHIFTYDPSNDALLKKMQTSQPQEHTVYRRTSLKRRVGYDQDEGEETP